MIDVHRHTVWLAVLLALAIGASGCSRQERVMRRLGLIHDMTLKSEAAPSTSTGDLMTVSRIWPTTTKGAEVFKGNFWASPLLVELPGKAPSLIVLPSSGFVASLDPLTGKRQWLLELPHGPDEAVELRAAPLQLGDELLVAYTVRDAKTGETGKAGHRAVMVDLRRGRISPRFKPLAFAARYPAAGGGSFAFDPEWQMPRAIAHIPAGSGLGHAYVAFGADRDLGGWHGWLFELDLDAWLQGGPAGAMSSVFATTNEAECDDGTKGLLCGGGLWAYAGPQVQQGAAGPEILIQTGNGRLDLSRGSYSQSLLRVRPGLKFDPGCDRRICSLTNPRDPSGDCLASCRNLFVPRLLPSDRPLRPADGSCDGLSYMACLEFKDWDFGSTSPVRVEAGGRAFYVTAGKAGDVFLLDADKLGVMYDRAQIVDLCGVPGEPCPTPNEGLTMTQPVAAVVDGEPVVIIPNYNTDDTHPAGVAAYRVRMRAGGPKLQLAWRVPDPSSPEARTWFRAPPTRPVLQTIAGEQVVWIADNGREGRLLALKVRNGQVVANLRTGGWPMRNSKPVIHNGVIYLPAAVPGRDDLTWIEAYRVQALK